MLRFFLVSVFLEWSERVRKSETTSFVPSTILVIRAESWKMHAAIIACRIRTGFGIFPARSGSSPRYFQVLHAIDVVKYIEGNDEFRIGHRLFGWKQLHTGFHSPVITESGKYGKLFYIVLGLVVCGTTCIGFP